LLPKPKWTMRSSLAKRCWRWRASWGKRSRTCLASPLLTPIAKGRATRSPRWKSSVLLAAMRCSWQERLRWGWPEWSPISPPGKAKRPQMFYLLAQWLEFEGLFNLVRYQTFRAGATLLTALAIGLVIGPKFINMLRVRQGKGQPIRADGPQTHLAKV